jgi:hypothetical protein
VYQCILEVRENTGLASESGRRGRVALRCCLVRNRSSDAHRRAGLPASRGNGSSRAKRHSGPTVRGAHTLFFRTEGYTSLVEFNDSREASRARSSVSSVASHRSVSSTHGCRRQPCAGHSFCDPLFCAPCDHRVNQTLAVSVFEVRDLRISYGYKTRWVKII